MSVKRRTRQAKRVHKVTPVGARLHVAGATRWTCCGGSMEQGWGG